MPLRNLPGKPTVCDLYNHFGRLGATLIRNHKFYRLEEGGEAETGSLHLSASQIGEVEQNVFRFQVAVHDIKLGDILETCHDLAQD